MILDFSCVILFTIWLKIRQVQFIYFNLFGVKQRLSALPLGNWGAPGTRICRRRRTERRILSDPRSQLFRLLLYCTSENLKEKILLKNVAKYSSRNELKNADFEDTKLEFGHVSTSVYF